MGDFTFWWQHLPSQMNPVILSFGSFALRWYGTMYIIAFAVVYLLARYRLRSESLPFSRPFIGDALTWVMLGVILGGRLGYLLFYGLGALIADPLGTLLPWSTASGGCAFSGISGMSYHGGLIGVAVALFAFTKARKTGFLETVDLFIPAVPLGYTFGRLGNFINGELYGRVTDAAIGMYFPMAGTHQLRHPSQLYEALFEGIVLFVILWSLRRSSPFPGFLSAVYLFGYGLVRFFIEFYREPDAHIGFVAFSLSMGQLLCLAMMLAGVSLFFFTSSSAKKVRTR
ncbi:prolipoprotein diacylglyceryl transferase [Chlorobium phaeovibrioides]|uniref:prolipoprotein diacylglyceryl transferase n=1 Tax=Chlorobium phaeovibrioides TaxID=1094 RepID=UPI000F82F3E5|nr:prolipoprotein diacylglyceryl transferase [Chlorobium phaeovibrioides]RTY34989.1 prolipoprotein diacylglyceryl transferase [Chlorobium phaeovibrioides]